MAFLVVKDRVTSNAQDVAILMLPMAEVRHRLDGRALSPAVGFLLDGVVRALEGGGERRGVDVERLLGQHRVVVRGAGRIGGAPLLLAQESALAVEIVLVVTKVDDALVEGGSPCVINMQDAI